MLTGTPVLTTKLPGMPKEYNKYVYLIENENEIYLAKRIKEILDKSQQELNEFGDKAKRFVLNNKNNIKQTKKIIKLIGEKYE